MEGIAGWTRLVGGGDRHLWSPEPIEELADRRGIVGDLTVILGLTIRPGNRDRDPLRLVAPPLGSLTVRP
jgi:hypothetical protein